MEIWLKDVDLEEPTPFLDHVSLGCTQRECTTSSEIVTKYRDTFEARISAGAKEKLPTDVWGKLDAENISSWSYDMEGHAKECVERYCELANKTTQQQKKVATPCMDDHQKQKGGNWASRRNVNSLFTKLFSSVCIWLELGDLTFYGLWINLPVQLLNVQKQVTNACRVESLTCMIQVNTENSVVWETHSTANVNLDSFKTQTLQEISKTQNQHQEEFHAFSEVTRLCTR